MLDAVFFFELFDFHVHGIRQFFAQIAEQFFAHDFHGEEAAGFVRNHVFGIHGDALGQVGFEQLEQVGDAQPVFRADGFGGGKVEFAPYVVDKGLQGVFVFCFVFVDFIDRQNHGGVFGQLFDDGAVGFGEAHGFDDEDDGIYARQGFGNVLVEAVVQCVAVVGLEAGGIDEDELGGVVGVDAGYFVARGLCFFAGDADFLPDEVVHQGGFADVGTADDGDEAAAVAVWDGVFGTRGVGVGHWFSFLQV